MAAIKTGPKTSDLIPLRAMAHLPRWIRSERVDSAAMLSAFLAWQKENAVAHDGERPYELLFMVEHAIRPTVHVGGLEVRPQCVPAPVPAIPCDVAGCARCLSLRGGYQFRWYSRFWGREYQRTRRTGSWAPGEAEV